MLKKVLVAAALAGAVAGMSTPASADVCVDLYIVAADTVVVDEDECVVV